MIVIRLNLLKPGGYFTYTRFKIKKFLIFV